MSAGAVVSDPIVWHSNATWAPSGYGKMTQLFAPRIKALGVDVAVSAFWGLQGARLEAHGVRTYPKGWDSHGNDILIQHARDHFGGDERAGIVIPLTDIWVMHPDVLKELRVAAWVPVDHEPCQPPTVDVMRSGKVLPIAMSRFGERMLIDEGFKPVYVPHGFDGKVMRPLDQQAARAALGMPKDAYVLGMVAANQGYRKSFPQALRAFAGFRKRHPEALLYIHTWLGVEGQGFDLRRLIDQELGKDAPDAVMICDQYRYNVGLYGDQYLAQAYSSMDLLLNPSQGEGFGVCIVEGQACGTPVLVTNATAMPELVGAGYLVGGAPIYTQFQSWQLLPAIEEIEAALELDFALAADERLAMRKKAHAFALQYDADRVTEQYWVPALAEINDRLARRPKAAPRPGKKGTAKGRRKQ